MQSRDDSPQPERDFRQARSAARSTEPLPQAGADWDEAEVASPGWRSERSRTAARRRTSVRGLPTNTGDAMLWLQRGGWRWLALAAGIVVLLVIFLAVRNGSATTASEQPSTDALPAQSALLPTVTSAPVQPTAAPPQTQFFVVSGTQEQGLFLRPDPNTDKAPLKTLPEGTRVEKIGDEVQGGDYVWIKVRDPEGTEGWVARDFIQPAS